VDRIFEKLYDMYIAGNGGGGGGGGVMFVGNQIILRFSKLCIIRVW
jgi:hypothetical protein